MDRLRVIATIMALLITCFILALFIYFVFYYEKDKKILEQRGKNKARGRCEDSFIFPFIDENQDAPQLDVSDFTEGDPDDLQ